MKTSDFYYDLPAELIAQTPLERRDGSRLLCLDRLSGATEHRRFSDLPELLREGDLLVLNDSRVLPARLIGRKESGGTAEILLLRDLGDDTWECLVKPGKSIRTGTRITFGEGELTAVITEVLPDGNRLIRFEYSGVFLEALERLGTMPLPPYIKERLEDQERYQTVYSRATGSAAAPTAGLHFTEELIADIKRRGIEIRYLTLHVGLGTFRPVKTDNILEHKIHSEFVIIPDETKVAVLSAKREGRRVIAVGTTVCRSLESNVMSGTENSGWVDIFIYPGYEFKFADALITNFHLPESTLIMLVSAFAGREKVLAAYKEAIRERYRFFSFGDAMMIK
ncbi:MAG: tRNA preQ1(34) S-adenosylmethionine ribosyltransferase-isomerase QueA [Oscillospiraceae bacterium]|jgi:S-adenosylmethionine:tRNA ribosyltransferase-isomerase|nr:tRNA preQ1(34) S-adenosylmethionine ribosyltransferase-isomerase QueA [Oscillospiraceae bacterium]